MPTVHTMAAGEGEKGPASDSTNCGCPRGLGSKWDSLRSQKACTGPSVPGGIRLWPLLGGLWGSRLRCTSNTQQSAHHKVPAVSACLLMLS